MDGGIVSPRRVVLVTAGLALLGGSLSSTADAADVLPPPVVASPIVIEPADTPRFYATLTALFMTRGRADPQPILTTDLITAATATTVAHGMDASDFRFGWSFGLAGRAGFIVKDRVALEAGAFWLRPLEATVNMIGDGFYYVLETNPDFAQAGVGELDGATAYDVTRLRGYEGNVVANLSHGFAVYGGATYIRLRDLLEIETDPTQFDPVTYRWTTDNRMLGPQLGLRFFHEADRMTFGLDARAAYLFNSALATVDVVPTGDDPFGDTDAAKSRTLMLAAGVNTGFRLSDTLILSIGYQAMMFSHVALGFNQILGTVPDFGLPPDADLTIQFGQLVVHGLNAGLTLTY